MKKFLRAYDEIKFFHSFGIDIVFITSHKNSVFASRLYASFFFSAEITNQPPQKSIVTTNNQPHNSGVGNMTHHASWVTCFD